MANAANALTGLSGSKGHAEGTTSSAVSGGSIIIRDKDKQQQDVAELSRDVENANGSIAPIFDKEKEQQRLKEAQVISQIAGQLSNIVTTLGETEAMKAARDKHGNLSDAALRNTQEYKDTVKGYGTGSTPQMVVQAITGVLGGLNADNFGQALAGGLSPVMAQAIKHATGDNQEANLMAHAVWGALAAQLSGNNAAAGAAGAFSGELAAQYITNNYYGGKTDNLSEQERQQISTLATIAAGIAGGLAGNSTEAAGSGAQAGKNAVENNYLSLVARGCAMAAPCRTKVAEQLLEIGAKAGIAGIAGAAIKDVADKMTSDELDHLVTLEMMGNDDITGKYLSSLQDKNAPANTGGDQLAGTEGIGKLENPAQDGNKGTSLITPDRSGSNSSIITISPETQPGKNDGIFINPKPVENTGTSYISESSDKNSSISAGDFFKGTTYTDKVKQQASSGDFHSFPESVDGHSDQGTISVIIGGDGVERLKLEISGSYRGKEGMFEYIREPDGTINHRLFVPNR
jgi:filamentous hemagglutinin